MRRILLLLSVIIIGAFSVIGIKNIERSRNPQGNYKDFSVVNYQLEGKNYKLLVADNPEKWQRGLMFFRKLDGADGMIFIFPDKQYRTFWNKNAFLDLELLWIDEDKIVGKSRLPSIEKSKEIVTVSSPKEVNKVIELSL